MVGFSTWPIFFNSENYIIGQLGGARVRRKRSRWMIESRARVGNFIVLLEPSDRGLSTLRINGRHSFDPIHRFSRGGAWQEDVLYAS